MALFEKWVFKGYPQGVLHPRVVLPHWLLKSLDSKDLL
jgi:hypothetical protein